MTEEATDAGVDVRLRRLLDEQEIRKVLRRYARGVDRGDWELVGGTYHPDAVDDHGPYKGGVPGLLDWLAARFAEVVDSTHFLGQSLVEFTSDNSAFVETYFVSRRLVRPDDSAAAALLGPNDMACREVWGRYADEFEQRDARWAVVRRTVVVDARFSSPALGGRRHDDGHTTWGLRSPDDAVLARRHAGLGETDNPLRRRVHHLEGPA